MPPSGGIRHTRPVIPAPSITVSLSPPQAGARPVAVTLRLRYEMQCGWPGRGRLAIRFPSGMRLPDGIPVDSVRVNGTAEPTSGPHATTRELRVALPARPQILCDSIGPGTATVTFTRAARLGLPTTAGSYRVRVAHGADRFAGRFSVR
jgi:hypothetical protein